jgi:hypothetical protein
MDELKIIFWIVIGLVYLFARRKKAQPQVEDRTTGRRVEDEGPEPARPVTFEELLQEIQGMKKKEVPPPTISPVPVNRAPANQEWEQEYDDEPKGKKQLEDTQYDYRDHDKIYDVYEKAKEQAFFRPSLEETVKLEDTIVRFKQFKTYEMDKRQILGEEFFKELKDPHGFKKAFIMSEILKKRF